MDAVGILGKRALDHLCALSVVLAQAYVPSALIGASALLLHGVPLPRTTRDLDLGVGVDGGLGTIRPILLTAGLSATGIEHRFRWEDGDEIDVLAIDPTASPPHEIHLETGDRIRAVGLREAIDHAEPKPIGSYQIFLAPLEMLITVKLCVATNVGRPHDLEDACVALSSYGPSDERKFEIAYDELVGLDYETSGAFLAGADAGRLLSQETRSLVEDALGLLLADVRLSDRFASGLERKRFVNAFQQGLTHAYEDTVD